MNQNNKCTKCFGKGRFMAPQGITRADIITCDICNGSGTHAKKKPTSPKRRYKYDPCNKYDGVDNLKKIEAE